MVEQQLAKHSSKKAQKEADIKSIFKSPSYISSPQRRHVSHQKEVVKVFPRPTSGPLLPIVHGQTLKYNMKVRAGMGFSLEELKGAGILKKLAPTIGIIMDHMRRNKSLEGIQTNVPRLMTYKSKLVWFPRCAGKFKNGDSTTKELASATQVTGDW